MPALLRLLEALRPLAQTSWSQFSLLAGATAVTVVTTHAIATVTLSRQLGGSGMVALDFAPSDSVPSEPAPAFGQSVETAQVLAVWLDPAAGQIEARVEPVEATGPYPALRASLIQAAARDEAAIQQMLEQAGASFSAQAQPRGVLRSGAEPPASLSSQLRQRLVPLPRLAPDAPVAVAILSPEQPLAAGPANRQTPPLSTTPPAAPSIAAPAAAESASGGSASGVAALPGADGLGPVLLPADTPAPAETASPGGRLAPSPAPTLPVEAPSPLPNASASPGAPVSPASTPSQSTTPQPTATPRPLTAAPSPTAAPTAASPRFGIRTSAPAEGFIGMADMAPGDCVTRTVELLNTGTLPFDTYTLSTSAEGGTSALWTDPTNGLQLRVRRGSRLLYEGPIAVSNLDLQMAVAPGGVDTLEIRVCLPPSAPNSMQQLAQRVTFTWTATGG